jgi:hypothetical protein
MPKYTVHIYATVRVPITFEAGTMEGAVAQAVNADLYDTLTTGKGEVDNGYEYAGEITGFLVDVQGATDHSESRSFDANGIEITNEI